MTQPEFVTCAHPDLPGATAAMAKPRNGWEPVEAAPEAPTGKSTKAQIEAYAAAKSIDLAGAKTKKAMLAALEAAPQNSQPEQPAGQDSPNAGASTTTTTPKE